MTSFYSATGAPADARARKTRNNHAGVVLPPAAAVAPAPRRASGSPAPASGRASRPDLGITARTAASRIRRSIGATEKIANPAPVLVEQIDPDTGEILRFEQRGAALAAPRKSVQEVRNDRYTLHDSIRQILGRHRCSLCLWAVQSKTRTVQILNAPEFNASRFNNLQTCGSVWVCPFCSAKISERRRKELSDAFVVAVDKGFKAALLTCTVPHVLQEPLEGLIAGLSKAWRSFTQDRAAKAIRVDLGLVGTIRNTEVTHGVNGWHPHFHCVVFYTCDVDLAEIEERWSAQWQHCCVKAGLRRPSDEHGLTLQDGSYAAKYVSKWGMEHELTKSAHKVARRGGRTPFDIARDFGNPELTADRDENARLFREFEAAFKGVRQLFWSKGLKKLLAVVEVSDEELAVQEDEHVTECLFEFNQDEWKVVRRGHRATVLELSERQPDQLRAYVDSVCVG